MARTYVLCSSEPSPLAQSSSRILRAKGGAWLRDVRRHSSPLVEQPKIQGFWSNWDYRALPQRASPSVGPMPWLWVVWDERVGTTILVSVSHSGPNRAVSFTC